MHRAVGASAEGSEGELLPRKPSMSYLRLIDTTRRLTLAELHSSCISFAHKLAGIASQSPTHLLDLAGHLDMKPAPLAGSLTGSLWAACTLVITALLGAECRASLPMHAQRSSRARQGDPWPIRLGAHAHLSHASLEYACVWAL
jgi:hypothetical protein